MTWSPAKELLTALEADERISRHQLRLLRLLTALREQHPSDADLAVALAEVTPDKAALLLQIKGWAATLNQMLTVWGLHAALEIEERQQRKKDNA